MQQLPKYCGGHFDGISYCLWHNYGVSEKKEMLLTRVEQYGVNSELKRASREGKDRCVRFLLEHAPDVSSLDLSTALNYACLGKYSRTIRVLLKFGAVPHQNALQDACTKGHLKGVELLVPYFSKQDCEDALIEACSRGQSGIANCLIQHGVNPECRDNEPIIQACRGVHEEVAAGYSAVLRTADVLIKAGASSDARNSEPLYLTLGGHDRLRNILLQNFNKWDALEQLELMEMIWIDGSR